VNPIIIAAAMLLSISSTTAEPRVERIATMRPNLKPQPFTATSGYVKVKTYRILVRSPPPVSQGFVMPMRTFTLK